MIFRKNKFIKTFKSGETIHDVFFVKFKKGLKKYKEKVGSYMNLTLADSSGNIDFKLWGDHREAELKEIYSNIKSDSIVLVKAEVSEYNGRLQLKTTDYSSVKVLNETEFEKKDFIKPSLVDVEKMYLTVLEKIELVKDVKLKLLLTNIFSNEKFSKKFKNHPAAIQIHHNRVGGLLQHTLETLEYCLTSAKNFPELNIDLLITGSLLHDIGKLKELQVTSRIKGTRQGQLLGHIVQGTIFISKECEKVNLSDELKDKILHMLISHHGKNEYGSPKTPMFPEAVAIASADELSAKLSTMIEFIKNSKDETEDDFMYNKRIGTNILLR